MIVNWNRKEFLRACLASLARQAGAEFETIVVDNNSQDDSRAMLARRFPQVHTVESNTNLGFAKGCNLGAHHASGQYLLFLNSDTEVLADTLEQLAEFLDQHAEVGVVTSRLVYPDFSDQGVARSFPRPANAILGRNSLLTKWFPNNQVSRRYLLSRHNLSQVPFEVDWVSGACLMIRSEVFKTIGGFDERFFMYWEDADLCFRVKQRAWKIFIVPEAKVVHYEGKSPSRKARQIVLFHRNVYRFYRKNYLRSSTDPRNILAIVVLSARAVFLVLADQLKRFVAKGTTRIRRMRPSRCIPQAIRLHR